MSQELCPPVKNGKQALDLKRHVTKSIQFLNKDMRECQNEILVLCVGYVSVAWLIVSVVCQRFMHFLFE